MPRLFIAISLPPATIDFLKTMQRTVKEKIPDIKASWPNPRNMHLTLKFLGDMPHDKIEAIQSAMTSAAKKSQPLKLHAGGCGVFPSVKRPRVVWSGVKGEIQALSDLFCNLEQGLKPLGFPKEKRRFSPHFTLARLKGSHVPAPFVKLIQTSQLLCSDPFQCKEILLFKSDLHPSGARHTRLFSAPLQSD